MPIAGWGFAPGARGRQHGGAQAGRADAADRDPARRARARGRPARGRLHRDRRARARSSGSGSSPTPRAQGLLHRLDRRRPAHHARRGRPGQAGHPRARRQERQHRLRRRRPRARRRDARRTPSSTTPARTAAPAAGSWCSAACSTGSWSCFEPAVQRRQGRGRPARRGGRDGAADQRRSARDRARRTSRTPPSRSTSPSAARRPRARATGTRRPSSCPRSHERPGLARGGLRAGRRGAAVRRRGRRDRARPTTRRTGCPGRSGPATSAAALRVARGVEAGNLSVNSHSSVRYSTPFGGFKQSGLGRELGPGRARRRSPRSRTSSSRTD